MAPIAVTETGHLILWNERQDGADSWSLCAEKLLS